MSKIKVDLNSSASFVDLTLGITQTLEKRKGVVDVKLQKKNGIERSQILTWEQRFSCIMPEDMKSFYLTSNGLYLSWSVKMTDNKVPLGKMEINPLDKLIRLGGTSSYSSDKHHPGLSDIVDSDDESGSDDDKPKFDHRSRIFELDPCDGYGKVCYVYKNTKPGIPAQRAEVWFLDRALQWHYLADSFLNYFRLMLTHLGLPNWQYAFTDIGLPPQSQQWFNLYCPMHIQQSEQIMSSESTSGNNINFNADRVFRGKVDKKKTTAAPISQNQNKKKLLTTSTRQPASTLLKPFSQTQTNKPNR